MFCLEHRAHVAQADLAAPGQPRAFGVTLEELRAELKLEAPNGIAHGRLCKSEFNRGALKTAEPVHGLDNAELFRPHRSRRRVFPSMRSPPFLMDRMLAMRDGARKSKRYF